jgi:hypothetical protein
MNLAMAHAPTPTSAAHFQSIRSIKHRMTDRFDFCLWTVVHPVHVFATRDEPSEAARCR